MKLHNIKSYTLLSYNKTRIFLFGEHHNIHFKCDNGITIAEYCADRVKKNPKCKILLEYNKHAHDPSSIGSESIRSIYNELSKKRKTSNIIPVDVRTNYMTASQQDALYGYKKFDSETRHEIMNLYPLTTLKLDTSGYRRDAYNTLLTYKNKLLKELDSATTQEQLKRVWSKVMDFHILKMVLKNKSSEYILVVGDFHRRNISSLPIFKKLNMRTGECFTINRT